LSATQQTPFPKHIAIIMDGNGRWAKKRGFGRTWGHRQGAKTVDKIVTACVEMGISYLSLYAFSSENWNRPETEVKTLMRLLVQHLKSMDKKLIKNKVRLVVQGEIEKLPQAVQKELARVMRETDFESPRMVVCLCLSYGGRQEILRACMKMADKISARELNSQSINEETFRQFLYHGEIPDPELLIRTGGESRVSNFLLWQIAYAEIFVSHVYWPEFKKEDLEEAVAFYLSRERRFGKISEQLEGASLQ